MNEIKERQDQDPATQATESMAAPLPPDLDAEKPSRDPSGIRGLPADELIRKLRDRKKDT